jgi:hypothetical protein
MSAVFNAATDTLSRTLTTPFASSDNLTMMFWWKPEGRLVDHTSAMDYRTGLLLSGDVSSWAGFYSWGITYESPYVLTDRYECFNFEIGRGGVDGYCDILGGEVKQGVWTCLAYVRNGASSTHRVYKNGALNVPYPGAVPDADYIGGAPNQVSSTGTITFAPGSDPYTTLTVGDGVSSSWGAVQGVRVWNAALTQAELLKEMRSTTVVRTGNLIMNTPLVSDVQDISGQSQHWTNTGVTFESGRTSALWDLNVANPITVPRLRRSPTSVTTVLDFDFTAGEPVIPPYPNNAPGGPTYSMPYYWETQGFGRPAQMHNYGYPSGSNPLISIGEAMTIEAGVGARYQGTGGGANELFSALVWTPARMSGNEYDISDLIDSDYGQRVVFAEATFSFKYSFWNNVSSAFVYPFNLVSSNHYPGSWFQFVVAGDRDFPSDYLWWHSYLWPSWILSVEGVNGSLVNFFQFPWSAITSGHPSGTYTDLTQRDLQVTARLEVTFSSPKGAVPGRRPSETSLDLDDDFNADGIIRVWIDDVLHYENTSATIVGQYGKTQVLTPPWALIGAPSAGTLALVGQSVTLLTGYDRPVISGALSLTGQSIVRGRGFARLPAQGTSTWTGRVPSLVTQMTPSNAVLSLAGEVPTIVVA